MAGIKTLINANASDFDEAGYLEANPDVAKAIRQGQLESGKYHFDIIGHMENRGMVDRHRLISVKAVKRKRFEPFIEWDYEPPHLPNGAINCLPDYLAEIAGVEHTDAISQHEYIEDIEECILNE